VYWFHSHSTLFLEMVIRWFPLFVNISALSYIICMVGSSVFMSISGLHLFRFGMSMEHSTQSYILQMVTPKSPFFMEYSSTYKPHHSSLNT
jgi:hypothetical protein